LITEVGNESKLDMISSDEIRNFADIKETLENARLCAKDHFEKHDYKESIRIYNQIKGRLQWTKTADENEREEKMELLLKCFLNLAICSLKTDQAKKSLEMLDMYEGINENANQNLKFLFNKGKALMMNGDYNEAKSALTKALKLQPENQEIVNLITELKTRDENYKKESKNLYNKMFSAQK
jgi:tetratricopeptide (TPR) repeat protein